MKKYYVTCLFFAATCSSLVSMEKNRLKRTQNYYDLQQIITCDELNGKYNALSLCIHNNNLPLLQQTIKNTTAQELLKILSKQDEICWFLLHKAVQADHTGEMLKSLINPILLNKNGIFKEDSAILFVGKKLQSLLFETVPVPKKSLTAPTSFNSTFKKTGSLLSMIRKSFSFQNKNKLNQNNLVRQESFVDLQQCTLLEVAEETWGKRAQVTLCLKQIIRELELE